LLPLTAAAAVVSIAQRSRAFLLASTVFASVSVLAVMAYHVRQLVVGAYDFQEFVSNLPISSLFTIGVLDGEGNLSARSVLYSFVPVVVAILMVVWSQMRARDSIKAAKSAHESQLFVICSACGVSVPRGSNYCTGCAAPLEGFGTQPLLS